MTLKEELESINNQIYELTIRKNRIEKSLFDNASTFEEKFRIWYYSDNKKYDPYIIREKEYPLTAKYFRNNVEMDRNRLYDFTEYFEDSMGFFVDEELCNDPKYANERPSDEIVAMFEEMMNTNLGGFTCDW